MSGGANIFRGLSYAQKLFCGFYDGDGKKAAIAAGIPPSQAAKRASLWLDDPLVCQEIRRQTEENCSAAIATREELQARWTEIIRTEPDPEIAAKYHLMLGKSLGMFLDKKPADDKPKALPAGLSEDQMLAIAAMALPEETAGDDDDAIN